MLPANDDAHTRLALRRDRFARLTGACGTRVDCIEGCVSITIDGDIRDIVLSDGESLVVDSRAPVTVHAIHGPAALAPFAPAA